MTGRVLVVADPRDRLARAVARRVPKGQVYDAEAGYPASFTVLPTGEVQGDSFVLQGERVAWSSVHSVLVRPGSCWDIPARFHTVAEGVACHERRAAWAAWLRALPSPVVDRLSPAWFVDRSLHGHVLARGLALRLGTEATEALLPLEAGDTVAAYLIGGQVINAGRSSNEGLTTWLLRRRRQVNAWHRDTGLRFVRVVGCWSRRSWSIVRVDPAPSVAGVAAATVQALAVALVEELT